MIKDEWRVDGQSVLESSVPDWGWFYLLDIENIWTYSCWNNSKYRIILLWQKKIHIGRARSINIIIEKLHNLILYRYYDNDLVLTTSPLYIWINIWSLFFLLWTNTFRFIETKTVFQFSYFSFVVLRKWKIVLSRNSCDENDVQFKIKNSHIS